jgi:V/A-type H+-transporting ATPase subunit I
VIRLLPSLEAFSHVGWFLVVFGLYFVILSMLLRMALPPFIPWFIGIGFGAVIIFCEQKGGNFFANILKGLSNAFSLFLKAVGCFADIISYIRLFAVGLAGSLIGQIFNSMAVPADGFGSFGLTFIVRLMIAVVLLGFGHGLNLALTALSVIVHGVRLNLLEYAGNHLEMEWSGYEYKPFACKAKDFALKQKKKQ